MDKESATSDDGDELVSVNLINLRTGPFTAEECVILKKKISTEEKAAGSDSIPLEVLKRCNFDVVVVQIVALKRSIEVVIYLVYRFWQCR